LIFKQIFEKYANIKFKDILLNGIRVVAIRKTDMTEKIIL